MYEQTDGVTQKAMCSMAGVAISTISRALSGNNISPIPKNDGAKKLRYSVHDTRFVLGNFIAHKFHVTKKMHCFYNFKGGVGKTSICFQVASHLALMGFNVLVIDADPQGHLSTSLGFKNDESYCTLYDAIVGTKTVDDIITNIYEGLDCIPANLSLTRTEVALNELPKREERVSLLIDPIAARYDFIIFDTNPTISYLNRNIITCSNVIDIIVETQAYSLNGVKLLLSDISNFASSMIMKMPDILMFPNKYEDRTATSAEAMAVLNRYYLEYLRVDFAIRKSEEFNIASKLSKPLAFFCRYNSIAFEDVLDVIHFILEKSTIKKGD
jgi:chromosome partitioning protein